MRTRTLYNPLLIDNTAVCGTFGMMIKSREFVGFDGYRMGYQGSEKDDEIKGEGDSYTTEFRILDVRLGRWLSVDPEYTAWDNPYMSMSNNPILYNDVAGDVAGDDKKKKEDKVDVADNKDEKKKDPMFSNVSATFQGIKRTQIGGNVKLQINDDFTYIQPSSGQRISPDESSTLASVEATLSDRRPLFDGSVVLFRNHTKGDFLLPGNDVHFGLGNSQVGAGYRAKVVLPVLNGFFKGFSGSVSAMVGIGPQFSRFTSTGKEVSPGSWGVKGVGVVVNYDISFSTPAIGKFGFWNVISLTFSHSSTLHHARFSPFTVTDPNAGSSTTYSGLQFSTSANTDMVQINFNLHPAKRKVEPQ